MSPLGLGPAVVSAIGLVALVVYWGPCLGLLCLDPCQLPHIRSSESRSSIFSSCVEPLPSSTRSPDRTVEARHSSPVSTNHVVNLLQTYPKYFYPQQKSQDYFGNKHSTETKCLLILHASNDITITHDTSTRNGGCSPTTYHPLPHLQHLPSLTIHHVILPPCNHPSWFSGDLITCQRIFF